MPGGRGFLLAGGTVLPVGSVRGGRGGAAQLRLQCVGEGAQVGDDLTAFPVERRGQDAPLALTTLSSCLRGFRKSATGLIVFSTVGPFWDST